MLSNISLEEAQEKVEAVVKVFTNDYKIVVARRVKENALEKKITFGITVKKEDTKDEELFDKLASLTFEDTDFDDLKSEAFVEDRTVKEVYLLTALVKIEIY